MVFCISTGFLLSGIEYEYAEIQISRKQQPGKIRKLKIARRFVYALETNDHPNDERYEYQQPDECDKAQFKSEEYGAPERVDYELRRPDPQRRGSFRGIGKVHPCG